MQATGMCRKTLNSKARSGTQQCNEKGEEKDCRIDKKCIKEDYKQDKSCWHTSFSVNMNTEVIFLQRNLNLYSDMDFSTVFT